MTSPVPEDVMEAAGEVCSQIAEYGKPAQDVVASAILAERERCAKIANHFAAIYHQQAFTLSDRHYKYPLMINRASAAEVVAAAIRGTHG